MKKMNLSDTEKLTGGIDYEGWILFGLCVISCYGECQHYGCTNSGTDCSVGCMLMTL